MWACMSQGTVFAPTCEQLQTIVAAMFDAMIATVNTVNRVIYLKASHPVTYCRCPVSHESVSSQSVRPSCHAAMFDALI
jgi:hypothetical protein